MFANKVFVLVESASFCGEARDQCGNQLTDRGGKLATFQELSKEACDAIIIADTINFEGYEDREDAMLCVVHPSWVDESITFGRPLPPSQYTPDPKYFMSKVSICVVGLAKGDKEAICAGVVAAGGLYSDNVNRITTHVIAVNVNDPVCKEALKHDVKVTIPHWIDACLKLQRLVSDEPYLLPKPPILDGKADILDSGKDLDQWEYQSPGNRSQSRGSDAELEIGHSTVLMHKKFFLGSDLHLESMLSTVTEIIDNSGGSVVDDIHHADVYIGQYRSGSEYRDAAKLKCTIGNLTWLYYVVTHRTWVSPLQRLLHYPIVEGGIPQMRGMVISLTNYSGQGRQFLAKLITACGATFTRNLAERNTHLIAAYAGGNKYEAARYWNQHIVNHLWLEECYALWQVQSVTCPKYTYFPARLNMSGIVGKTLLDPRILRRFVDGDGQVPRDASTPADKRIADHAVHDSLVSYHNSSTPTRRTGSARPKRDARDKASLALHDAMEKENLFQKQFKSKDIPLLPEEVAAKKRKIQEGEGTESPSSRREATPTCNGQQTSTDTTPIPSAKAEHGINKRKDADEKHEPTPSKGDRTSPATTTNKTKTKTPIATGETDQMPQKLTFVTTGLKDFNYTTSELQKCGLASVARADRASLLIAERVFRSEKFLRAMHTATHIVKPSYVKACLDVGRLVYPIPEEHFVSVEIEEALSKSKQHGKRLLEGYFFNLRPNLRSSPEVVKGIIAEHGGKSQVLKGTTKLKPSPALGDDTAILIFSETDDSDTTTNKGAATVVSKSLDWLFDTILAMKVTLD